MGDTCTDTYIWRRSANFILGLVHVCLDDERKPPPFKSSVISPETGECILLHPVEILFSLFLFPPYVFQS